MAVFNPYLNFPGTTEEAFNFYKSVFGGELVNLQRYKDTPQTGRVSEADGEKLMHVSLPIGKSNVLMGTDYLESMGRPLIEGNNFSISVSTGSVEETDRIFHALSAGGRVTMALEHTFWGAYFGMTTDRFGIQWMVSYDSNYPLEN